MFSHTVSTSLWGRELKYKTCDQYYKNSSRPPCEVVNWNSPTYLCIAPIRVDLLVRSWIEMSPVFQGLKVPPVDLLVRSWIEIIIWHSVCQPVKVDLLVRSWIEMWSLVKTQNCCQCRPPCEVVNWNARTLSRCWPACSRPPCEVVNWNRIIAAAFHVEPSRPPCEVVNWNDFVSEMEDITFVDLLVRSWIEMYAGKEVWMPVPGRPPCEVVNWNIASWDASIFSLCRPPCEVVNWKDYIILLIL